MADALVLRNGICIERPLEAALEFVTSDGSYQRYDLAPVQQDNALTESDIRAANAIIARMPSRVIAGIFTRAPAINAVLARIPPSASLVADDADIPWAQLNALFRAMDGIPEVRLPRQTKVVHKKRPALIPILDSVVEGYLRQVDSPKRTGNPAAYAVDLIRSYKRELDANVTALVSLRRELLQRDIDLTECRLLDLFIWAYSGIYTPLFQRGEAISARLASSLPGHAAVEDGESRMAVQLFRDDDEGYVAWLSAHPHGYVLNVARRPRPDYLVLHRASCRTITGRPPRGGLWTGPYIKVCSDDELQIAAWTGREVGAPPRRCAVCR
jgi:hypothetical protein